MARRISLLMLGMAVIGIVITPRIEAVNWTRETVDWGVGTFTSLALDVDGWPYISYYDFTNSDLKYGYKDSLGWHLTTVDAPIYVGSWTSIALDSLSYPHISYHDHGFWYKDLKYAYEDGSGWHIEIVDSFGIEHVGSHTSIALDTDGYPHIVYFADYDGHTRLKYAYKDASGWHCSTVVWDVGGQNSAGVAFSIAIDHYDYPHISYFDDNNLRYTYKIGGSWHYETVESGCGMGSGSSIALDEDGYPHIAYNREGIEDLNYAYKDASGWYLYTVDSDGTVGDYQSIALDHNGYPHISYAYVSNWDLKYAYKDGAGWYTETVQSSNNVGLWNSIALNAAGEPHISYFDDTNDYLKFARPQSYWCQPFSLLSPGNGDWANTEPTFRWEACSYQGDSLSRYELWIDGLWNKNVPRAQTLAEPALPLSAGFHTWRVLAFKVTGDSIWSNQTWTVNIDATPPTAFNLLTPPDSTWTTDRTPTLTWQASSDAGSGLKKYQLFIDGSLARNNIPPESTSTIPLWNLNSGDHSWCIVAVDSVDNSSQSNQTWTVRIDYSGPSSFSLYSPPDYSYTTNTTPTFKWQSTTDAGVGMSHYQLWINSVLKIDSIPADTTVTWPQASISLNSYTGYNNVKIRFRFTSDFSVIEDGWYIDDVEIAADGSPIFSDDFESGTSQWSLQTPWGTTTSSSHSPSHSLTDSPGGNYSNNANTSATIVQSFDFSAVSSATLSFYHIYEIESGYDYGRVEISTDGGSSWTQLESYTGTSSALVDTLSVTLDSSMALTHGSYTWRIKALDKLGNYRYSFTWDLYVDLEPPYAFSLISPADSSLAFLPTPDFTWHSTSDYTPTSSGLSHYELWIDGVLNVGSLSDTSSAPSVPLSEGYHDWFVKAYDNVGNIRNSNETWTVILDWNPPAAFSLSSPADSDTVDIDLPTFFWHPSSDSGSGISKYELWLNGFVNQDSIPPSDTSSTPASPLANGTYTWFVKAYDWAGGVTSSNEVWYIVVNKDTIPPTVPVLISPANGANIADTLLTFIWHSSIDGWSGIDYYTLQYADNPSFISAVEIDTEDTVYTCILPDTTYYWKVRAVDNAANQSNWSAVWDFTIDTQIPNAPMLISPVGGIYVNDTLVAFEWGAVTFERDDMSGLALSDGRSEVRTLPLYSERSRNVNIDRAGKSRWILGSQVMYILQIDTLLDFTSPLIVDTLSTTSTTVPLYENFPFYWRVKAYDLAGNQGPYANPDSFGVDITPPSTVTLISPSDGEYLNNSTVNFIWNEASDNLSGVDHYVLQYALDSGFTQGLVETTMVDTVFTAVLPDTIYYWHVKAVDAANNEGEFSTTWQFEVDTQPPPPPMLNSPIGGIYLSDTLVTFEWSEVTFLSGNNQKKDIDRLGKHSTKLNILTKENERRPEGGEPGGVRFSPIRYILQVDTTTGFTSPLIVDTLTAASTTISFNEDFYYWRVKAYDLAGNQGPYANPDSFGVDITPPVIDSTQIWPDTTYVGPFEIRTKVIDNLAGLDSVLLYYRRDEDPVWVMEVMHQSGDWFTDTIPAVSNPDDTVRYYIKAIDNAEPGNVATDPDGAPVNYYSFIANMVGIEENIATPRYFSFGLKSSPARGKVVFNLTIPEAAEITLKIYDVSGRLIDTPVNGRKSAGAYKISWTSCGSAGVYFYCLESRWERKTGKFILIR